MVKLNSYMKAQERTSLPENLGFLPAIVSCIKETVYSKFHLLWIQKYISATLIPLLFSHYDGKTDKIPLGPC